MGDAAVRRATQADVPEITRIHRETWQTAYHELLPPDALETLDPAEAADAWSEAVTSGHVWLATEGTWTVGFCVAGQAPEPEIADADGTPPPDAATTVLIGTLLVEPRWGRRQHGTRLLTAALQDLAVTGATRAVTWALDRDHATLGFYRKQGWEPDGTLRTLDAGERTLREIRLTAAL
jgi:GNAT superfamily N-acetyltransferase